MRFVIVGTRRPSRLGCWQRWLTGGDASAVTCWALALLLRVMSGRSSRQQLHHEPTALRGSVRPTKAVPGRQRELFVVPTPTVRRGSAGVIASDESASLGCLLGLWQMLGIPSVLHAASGPHLRGFKVPREASAESSRAAAGSPRHEIGGEDTTHPRAALRCGRRFPNCSGSSLEETVRRGPVPLPLPPDPSVGLAQHGY